MTDNNHPITPPPELVQQWDAEAAFEYLPSQTHIATQSARWGADQELEACCEWFQEFYKTESWVKHDLKHFRTARRPKPPTLKEQALAALDDAVMRGDCMTISDALPTIRRALEALPE